MSAPLARHPVAALAGDGAVYARPSARVHSPQMDSKGVIMDSFVTDSMTRAYSGPDGSVTTRVSSLAAFRDLVAELAVLTVDMANDEREFRARVRHTAAGGVAVARIVGDAHTVQQLESPQRVKASRRLVFNVQLRGSGSLTQGAHSAPILAGDVVVYDASQPFEMTFDTPYERLAVIVPYGLLAPHSVYAESMGAVRLPSTDPVTCALGSALDRLEEVAAQANSWTRARTIRIVSETVDLLSASVTDDIASGRGAAYDGLRAVFEYIDGNLGDPDLSPRAIAANSFVSVRRLYRLFEEHGLGVAATIRERRLDSCRRDLDDRRLDGMSISAIAAANGFTSASHFSALFREAYNISPREYRQRVRGVD